MIFIDPENVQETIIMSAEQGESTDTTGIQSRDNFLLSDFIYLYMAFVHFVMDLLFLRYILFFLFIIAFFLLCLSVIAHDGQIIQIITDYECVTCHRIFQSQDVRF